MNDFSKILPILSTDKNKNVVLSFAQSRLWLLNKLGLSSSAYNAPAAYILTGSLDMSILKESLNEIADRHDILRTIFPSVNEQASPIILPPKTLDVSIITLPENKSLEKDKIAYSIINDEAQKPFDIMTEQLFRVKILRLSDKKNIIFFNWHHIIFDGLSFQIFLQELTTLYTTFLSGQSSPLPKLTIQYTDFACWQRKLLQGEFLESQLSYWKQQLNGNISALKLPFDRLPSPQIWTCQAARHSLKLSKNLTDALKSLSKKERVTLFITMITSFKILLYQYTAQRDLVVCTPVACRNQLGIEKLIGYFNNILPIYSRLSEKCSFRDFLHSMRRTTFEAYDYQDVPFQKIAELPNLLCTSLSQVMFVWQSNQSQFLKLPGITVNRIEVHNGSSNSDLSLFVEEEGEQLINVLEYKTALFNATTVINLLNNFQSLLENIVANPELRLESLPSFQKNRIDELKPLAHKQEKSAFVAPKDELEAKLAEIWKKSFGIQAIGIKDNFFELGGHSLLAVRLFAEIEKKFGKNLPLAILFQAPTIEQLAQALRDEKVSKPWHSLVPIQPHGSKPPLFCIHSIGGNALCYRNVAKYLGSEQPVYGLQSQGFDKKQAPLTKIEDMASLYIKEILQIQVHGPYFITGHSFGGLIAYEIARQLCNQNHQVAFVGIVDSKSPCFVPPPASFLNSAYIHFRNVLASEPQDKLDYLNYILIRLKLHLKKIKQLIKKGENNSNYYIETLPNDVKESIFNVLEANRIAAKNYSPSTYFGKITLFRCQIQETHLYYSWDLGWNDLAKGGVEIQQVSGKHLNVMGEPHARVLAKHLNHHIDKALTELEFQSGELQVKNLTEDRDKPFNIVALSSNKLAQTQPYKERFPPQGSVVPIQPNGTKLPLFLVHAAGGGVMYYRDLAHYQDPNLPIFGLQFQSWKGEQINGITVEDMASNYIQEIRRIQSEGPYFLGGSSSGGLIAFEIAQQLISQGQQVALLALFDTGTKDCLKRIPLKNRLSSHFDSFLKIGFTYVIKKVQSRTKLIVNRLKEKRQKITINFYRYFGLELPHNIRHLPVVETNKQATINYKLQVYPGRITLFRALHQPLPEGWCVDPQLGWRNLAGKGLDVHDVPGDHHSMFVKPHVQVLAEKLKTCIEKAQL